MMKFEVPRASRPPRGHHFQFHFLDPAGVTSGSVFGIPRALFPVLRGFRFRVSIPWVSRLPHRRHFRFRILTRTMLRNHASKIDFPFSTSVDRFTEPSDEDSCPIGMYKILFFSSR